MAERINILETEYPIDRSNWIDVFSATLGPMWCIQNAFGESVAKNKLTTVAISNPNYYSVIDIFEKWINIKM